MLLESGGVGQEIPQGDIAGEAALDVDVDVGADVGVQIEFALFDELHDGDAGGQLRHRADAEEGVGIHQARLLAVGPGLGVSVASRREDLAVMHHRDDRPWDLAPVQGIGEFPVQPGVDVLCCELVLSLRL